MTARNSEQIHDFSVVPLWDDNPSRVDLLGFADIVAAVESTITRDELQPITVGVNAPWGGGKTTVLRLLEEKLKSRADVIVVYVSPWEYDRTTDAKASLIGTVLERLEEQVKGEQTVIEAVGSRLRELRNRVNVAKAVKLAATTALTMTIPNISELASIFDSDGQATSPTLQGFREQFATLLFEDALKHVKQVVILVDDLDRSLPDMVVETLEAIKLFLSVDRMAFVVAADEDNVARAIGQRLESTGQPTTAHQYLEKIVQIPFRIPALTRELTEEYLALLLLGDDCEIPSLIQRARETRGEGLSLAARFGELVPDERRTDVELAERLSPILHRHTQGNPRRLKRFLNALWLRTAFARSRGVVLQADACSKLMVAELMYPDFFAQMLGWLSSGTLSDNIMAIEKGEGDYSDQIMEWGQLIPSLEEVDLPAYMLLAASLRSETIEEAVLPPELRVLAAQLMADSNVVRNSAIEDASTLENRSRATLARFVASQLRHQGTDERQRAVAESLSGLADESIVASTIAEEIGLMDPSTVLTPVPLSLLAKNRPAELVEVVRRWSLEPLARERTRLAAKEALSEVS